MISFVIVSHSARLAEGVCELASQVAQGRVPIAAAGGTGDPEYPLGTDAFRVLEAIESVYSDDGVLVLMDLGSAVLSAETALEMLDERRRAHVRLCPAPVVEGTIAGVSLAAAGAELDEILQEAREAGQGKLPVVSPDAGEERRVTLVNPLGLHARPAAQLIRRARSFTARVTLENMTTGTGPADAASMSSLLGLGARQGHTVLLHAEGPDARRALDEIAVFIASGLGDLAATSAAQAHEPSAAREGELRGLAASPGYAVGPFIRLHPAQPAVIRRTVDDSYAERDRLLAALGQARKELDALHGSTRASVGANEAGIFESQLLLLEDAVLIEQAAQWIQSEHGNAEYAWHLVSEELAEQLERDEDPYLRARATDVRDAAARVIRVLTGSPAASQTLSEPSIVVAYDLTPSEVKALDAECTLAICLEAGSASAHSIVLARAMGIPAVAGLGSPVQAVAEGTVVAVDGERGLVWLSPTPEQVEETRQRRTGWLAARQEASAVRLRPAQTADGRRIRVYANTSGVNETADAVAQGAEGIGVLRTEFLFLHRSAAPSEEEQLAAYLAIGRMLGPRPLVIRTLDAGGDKSLPYLDVGAEANPFLGWRGIRVTLGQRDLLHTQFRAILRAGAEQNVEVLLPMISTLDELRTARAMLRQMQAELDQEGLRHARDPRLGVMIEVPAAVAIADALAREADFFSIGTNDLTQYVMAADRTNARLGPLANPLQPAVLRFVGQTVQAAKRANIPVTLCGELAADPQATALLIGMGLDEFSVSPPFIPALKRAISVCRFSETEALTREVLAVPTLDEVQDRMRNW